VKGLTMLSAIMIVCAFSSLLQTIFKEFIHCSAQVTVVIQDTADLQAPDPSPQTLLKWLTGNAGGLYIW